MEERYLSGASCYLSGPIENDDVGHNWRVEPSSILINKFNIDLFDPFADPKQQWVPTLKKATESKDYETIVRITQSFVRKDLAKIDRTDFVIAHLPYKVPTTGTHHEIINSVNAKKPTLLVCPQGKEKIPLWYFGFIPHSVMFGSWDALYEYLDEVDQGKHKDNRRWSLVYKSI